MTNDTASLNALRGYLIVEELRRMGVRDVCIAPGSRSTPLTLAAAENDGIRTHVHFDERGLSFFALGLAKGGERPVALICSSGTATANLHPAMVEAHADRIPLIVLTADRPWELHDVGANQSVDQLNLYAPHVRRFNHLPAPSSDDPPEAVLGLIDDLVSQTRRGDGPVHLNVAFREPFVPNAWQLPAGLDDWKASDHPFSTRWRNAISIQPEAFGPLIGAERGLIIAGRLNRVRDRQAARRISQAIQWPLIADVTSGLRLSNASPTLIAHADLLPDYPKPDAILYLGGPITSKPVIKALGEWRDVPMVQVQPTPDCNNPRHRPANIVVCDLEQAEEALPDTQRSGLLESYQSLNDSTDLAAERDRTVGGKVAATISEHLPEGHALFLGNSLTIREFNAVSSPKGQTPCVCCNRGASGIDGNVATAAGFAIGSNAPLTAVVGDLTALHDLNSLPLLKKCARGAVVIVVNNDGGGIFERLPIAIQTEHFDAYFKTPHGFSLTQAAAGFGLSVATPSATDLAEAFRNAVADGGHWLLEVRD